MNEFDLRKFLYNNPLLESEKKLKAKKKELEKKEDKLDSIDMKDEDAKEKAAHHKGAIKNVKKEIKDLEKDLKFDEKAAKKEEKEAKAEKKKKAVKEGLTKEGLKSMIREKITSILNEDSIEEAEDEEVDDVNVDIDKEEDIKVTDKETVDIDDESAKSETEIDGEIAGESPEKAAVLSLLTKAQGMVPTLGGDEEKNEKMVNQINNTITMFARDYLAQAPK